MAQPPGQAKIGRDISLEDYLNQTKDKHRGNGWNEWRNARGAGLGATALARLFGVAKTDTIYKWIEAEKGKA